MIRTAMVITVAFLLAFGLSGALAQETPPTPGPDEIALVGQVPAPAGTTVTVRTMDLDAGVFSDCVSVTSTAGDGPDASDFTVLVPASCLQDAEGLTVCWGAAPEDCAVIAATGPLATGVPSIDDLLGQTVDTGLLTGAPLPDPSELVPPHGDVGPTPAAGLPSAGTGPEQQAAQRWPLWAGAVVLGAGLALGAVALAATRRR